MSMLQRWTRGAAAAAVTLATVVAGFGPIAPTVGAGSATPPALGVSPSTGLADNQAVVVTTPHGASAADEVDYVQCPSAAADSQDCAEVGYLDSSASTTTVRVLGQLLTADDDLTTLSTVDCRTASCTLRAVRYNDTIADTDNPDDYETTLAETALHFDPTSSLRAAPTVTVTPSTDLKDNQNVTVTMTSPGMADELDTQSAAVFPCAAPISSTADLASISTNCDLDQFVFFDNASGDTATATVPVRGFVQTAHGPVDCRAVGATCTYVAFDPIGQTANAPLTFDPDAPLTPSVLARPYASDNFDNMTFDLVGFTPNDPFTVRWCNDSGKCLPGTAASGMLDASGMGSFVLSSSVFPDIPNNDTTCSDSCDLTVSDAHGLTATGGFSFGGETVGPVGPFNSARHPVTVTPHKGLHDGDEVTVSASGFQPGADLTIVECTGNALSQGVDGCDTGTSSFLNGQDITADANGNMSATYKIQRNITTSNGPTDCITGNIDPDAYQAGITEDPSREKSLEGNGYSTCIIGVADLGDYSDSGGAPIAFAGAHFKPLPWQIIDRIPKPISASTPATSAHAATPVAAQPTFTG